MIPEENFKKEVEDTVYRIFECIKEKDVDTLESMHAYDDKRFSKFDADGLHILNADQTRSSEREAVLNIIETYHFDRSTGLDTIQVQLFYPIAIAAFVLNVHEQFSSAFDRRV